MAFLTRHGRSGTGASYFAWALAVPALFLVFGSHPRDRLLGELSYPIYLTHLIVAAIVSAVLDHFGVLAGSRGAVVAAISILVSVALYRWVATPIERKRHKLTT